MLPEMMNIWVCWSSIRVEINNWCIAEIFFSPWTPHSYIPLVTVVLLHCRCVNHGVLPPKKAAKLFKIVTERKRQSRMGGSSSASTTSPKKKKAKLVSDAVEPDLQVSGAHRVGSSVIWLDKIFRVFSSWLLCCKGCILAGFRLLGFLNLYIALV